MARRPKRAKGGGAVEVLNVEKQKDNQESTYTIQKIRWNNAVADDNRDDQHLVLPTTAKHQFQLAKSCHYCLTWRAFENEYQQARIPHTAREGWEHVHPLKFCLLVSTITEGTMFSSTICELPSFFIEGFLDAPHPTMFRIRHWITVAYEAMACRVCYSSKNDERNVLWHLFLTTFDPVISMPSTNFTAKPAWLSRQLFCWAWPVTPPQGCPKWCTHPHNQFGLWRQGILRSKVRESSKLGYCIGWDTSLRLFFPLRSNLLSSTCVFIYCAMLPSMN